MSTLTNNEPVIRLPHPMSHQVPILDSDARRKVIRAGRRFGKSRLAMIAALDGHGPKDSSGKPLFEGVLQGGDVVWVAQDYPNLSTVMWREEFQPRFKHLPFVNMNAQRHDIEFEGLGTLFLRPETAISGIRGIGKNLKGVILDEAAHYDLGATLLDVVLPALLDNDGWLILMSTTNAGWDGNAERETPSYFNRLCEKIRAGEMEKDWQEFRGTAYDNPRLSADKIDELVNLYEKDSPSMKQEVHAELLAGGVGFALSQLDEKVHIIPQFRIPDHWVQFGAFDWGYQHPFCFGHFATDEDGNVYLADSVHGFDGQRMGLPDLRNLLPQKQVEAIKKYVPLQRLNHIVAGHDVKAEQRARGSRGPTIAEQWAELGYPLTLANIARVAGLNNMRRYVDFEENRPPRFYLMDTPGNRYTFKVLQRMQLDDKNLEDALKVDAALNGLGGDDPYDMVRYGLMSRPIAARVDVVATFGEDRHPGFEIEGKKIRLRKEQHPYDRIYGNNGKFRLPGFRKAYDDE